MSAVPPRTTSAWGDAHPGAVAVITEPGDVAATVDIFHELGTAAVVGALRDRTSPVDVVALAHRAGHNVSALDRHERLLAVAEELDAVAGSTVLADALAAGTVDPDGDWLNTLAAELARRDLYLHGARVLRQAAATLPDRLRPHDVDPQALSRLADRGDLDAVRALMALGVADVDVWKWAQLPAIVGTAWLDCCRTISWCSPLPPLSPEYDSRRQQVRASAEHAPYARLVGR